MIWLDYGRPSGSGLGSAAPSRSARSCWCSATIARHGTTTTAAASSRWIQPPKTQPAASETNQVERVPQARAIRSAAKLMGSEPSRLWPWKSGVGSRESGFGNRGDA